MSDFSRRVESIAEHMDNCRAFLLRHPNRLMESTDIARWFSTFIEDMGNAIDGEPIHCERDRKETGAVVFDDPHGAYADARFTLYQEEQHGNGKEATLSETP